MDKGKVIIEVTPQGDTKVKVEGVPGPGCQDLSRNIEKALGRVTGDVPTGEMCEVNYENRNVNRY